MHLKENECLCLRQISIIVNKLLAVLFVLRYYSENSQICSSYLKAYTGTLKILDEICWISRTLTIDFRLDRSVVHTQICVISSNLGLQNIFYEGTRTKKSGLKLFFIETKLSEGFSSFYIAIKVNNLWILLYIKLIHFNVF